MRKPIRAIAAGLVACPICGLIVQLPSTVRVNRCRRCDSKLWSRVPRSTERTAAWLSAALLLYVPANLLPVMHTSGVQGSQDSTILSGVASFWEAGSWDLALLIFFASVVIPVTKFLALGLMLWTIRLGSVWGRRQRAKLYRVIDFIGYWSMLDVVVVAITAALFQLKAFGSAEPRLGILFFCLVVLTTMLAAKSFDPRLIWDDRR